MVKGFKRIKDLRHTLKISDLKRSNSQEFKPKPLVESTTTQTNNNKRRLSEHFQSSIKKLLDKKTDSKSDGVQNFLKSFRKDKLPSKLFSSNKYKSNCSILNETNEFNKSYESHIELKLNNETSHLNTSHDTSQIDQSTILKFETLLNENKREITTQTDYEFFYCDSVESFNSMEQQLTPTKLSSKSSINSEEGYYSNHDSSSNTSTLCNDLKPDDLMELDEPILSINMFDCKLSMPVDYSRFSYNCYPSNINIPQQHENVKPEVVNDLKAKLTRNKFTSLCSLKHDLRNQDLNYSNFQMINKSNSYVSEIKLFFDKNTNRNLDKEEYVMKSECSSESDDFKINIKDLISKFEKNK